MVTLSRERPLVPQINRACLGLDLRGAFRPDSWDLFSTVSRAERVWYGQTDPGALQPSTDKKPPALEVLDEYPEGCPGHRAAASNTELQLLRLFLLRLLPLLLLLLLLSVASLPPPLSPFLPPSIPSSLSICVLQGIKKPYELMKMSEVIKRGGDGDTDPGRVSEGQEVHMGPRPACSTISLLPPSLPPSPWSPGCMAHRYGLIGLLGTGRMRVGEVGTQGRWRGVD